MTPGRGDKLLTTLAGAPGFEPGNGGIKIRCLTTWRRPNAVAACAAAKTARTILAGPDARNRGEGEHDGWHSPRSGCHAGPACASTVPAGAASFPCNIPFLKPAELAICQDTQLSRLDDDTARKARSLLSRLCYGQYLGLRYWQSRNAEAREQCGSDRECLVAQYRAQTTASWIACGNAWTAARNGARAGAPR